MDELTAKMATLQSEYKKAQREEREYDTIRQNVKDILKTDNSKSLMIKEFSILLYSDFYSNNKNYISDNEISNFNNRYIDFNNKV